MFIHTKDGYIETRIYQSIYHGPLNFDITGLYCTKYLIFIGITPLFKRRELWWDIYSGSFLIENGILASFQMRL